MVKKKQTNKQKQKTQTLLFSIYQADGQKCQP